MPKNFNPQFIKEKLNAGWLLEDFLAYYEVDEDTLHDFMRTHTSNPVYSDFEREVKKNKRLAKRLQRDTSEGAPEPPTLSKENPSEEASCDSKEETTPVRVVDPTTQKIEEFEREIQIHETHRNELTRTQSELNAKIEESNKTIKNNLNKINSCNAELSEAQKAYENIKKICEMKIKNLVDANASEKERITECEEQLTQTGTDIITIDSYISECQQYIRDLKKITVTITNNYEIVIDKPFEYTDESEQFYSQLKKEAVSGRMFAYQLDLCATLLTIKKALQSANQVYEIVFAPDDSKENESLKAFFELAVEKFL